MNIFQAYSVVNGAWALLSLSIFVIFAHYLLTIRGRNSLSTIGPATALAIYFLGATVQRTAMVIGLHYPHQHSVVALLLGGSILAAVGALWIVRAFSPTYWSSWVWLLIGLVSLVFGIALTYPLL